MQRPDGHEADDRRAVGIGDDAVVGGDGLGVDLGDDEGNIGVEPEGVGVVYADGPAHDRLGKHRRRLLVADGGKHDVDALECLGIGLDYFNFIAHKRQLVACRAGAREAPKLAHGEAALLEAAKHLLADDAGGAEYCNALGGHPLPFPASSNPWQRARRR